MCPGAVHTTRDTNAVTPRHAGTIHLLVTDVVLPGAKKLKNTLIDAIILVTIVFLPKGIVGSPRDFSPESNKEFAGQVPAEMLTATVNV